MKDDLLQKHFQRSGFDEMQADTLAAVFAQFREEMATKQDLTLLRTELKAEIRTLRTEMTANDESLRQEMAAGLNGLRTEMATLKDVLTWRFIALTAFFATVMALVGLFVA